MPPKAKFTKEEIVKAALQLVREKGSGALTARALAEALGSSSRPIFTTFDNMEEVERETVRAAKELYGEYVARGLAEEKPFKGVGKRYILFAVREPKLFQLLFMGERKDISALSFALPALDNNYEKILSSLQEEYGLGKEVAEGLYKHLWIYTHGIATLCATKTCRFTGEEIGELITEVFSALLEKAKKGEKR